MLEIILPVMGTILVAVIAYIGKKLDNKSNMQVSFYRDIQDRYNSLTSKVEELTTQTFEDRRRIAILEDSLRDKEELLKDMKDIALWIADGSKPPSPQLTWRVRHYLNQPTTGQLPQQ